MFACAKAGAILHPISWRLAPAEVAFQLDDARACVLPDRGRASRSRRGRARARERSACPDGRRRTQRGRQRRASDDDPLLLIYTSGTTGKPKGALADACELLLDQSLVRPGHGHRPDDVVLQVLPQFHCGGWNVQSILAWWKGAKVVLERGFDPARTLELIERERVTTLMGVPANYLFMAQEQRFAEADLSSLRLAVVGGAPMPVALLDVWAARGCRHRAGIRPHRSRAQRALPAAGGRAAQGRLRGQAVPVRHL